MKTKKVRIFWIDGSYNEYDDVDFVASDPHWIVLRVNDGRLDYHWGGHVRTVQFFT